MDGRVKSSQVDRSWWPCLSFGRLEVLRVWETISIRVTVSATQRVPWLTEGHSAKSQPSKRRIAGKDDEGVVMCVEDAQGKSQIENVEEGSVRFRPRSPCLNLSLSTGPPSSLIVLSYLPLPPLESLRHGHELSSVLGRSQNLWLFHL
jgi:hypothetical protein